MAIIAVFENRTMSEPQRSCVIIGIAGASASGKSLIAHTIFEELVLELGEDQIGVITEDCYYKDQSHLVMEERVKTNYDHSNAFDHSPCSSELRCSANREWSKAFGWS